MSAASRQIEIRLDRIPPVAEVAALYREVGWLAPGDSETFLPAMLAGSRLIATACEVPSGRCVGMARALSDGVSDACIQDVVVAGAYRKQGIGRRLVCELTGELSRRGVDFIELIAVPGSEAFYRACGFVPMPDHTPMKHRG